MGCFDEKQVTLPESNPYPKKGGGKEGFDTGRREVLYCLRINDGISVLTETRSLSSFFLLERNLERIEGTR